MSLAEIRAKLQAQENRSQQNQSLAQTDNSIYPFWNMDDGLTAVVRFLPDGDKTNTYFWVERAMIKLPFTGIKNQSDNKEVIVQVPCMEMYGENCPILAQVRTWYKDESLKEMANKYWKKRTYIFQGFVRTNPMSDDKAPENPIRRFVISPQIFTIIKSTLLDPEIDVMPTDYQNGLDFRIVKGTKGSWADYSTSSWARKESSLTALEQEALETHGLFNLRDFLPKKPSESELRVIKEMFDASVDGRPYDPDKWAAYYKPYGLQVAGKPADQDSESSVSSVPTVKVAESVSTAFTDEEIESSVANNEVKVVSPSKNEKTQDILAMIRQRQNKVA